ncbi:uncharacterized protein F5891DRAFT_979627 [Suillus fuscotomentosus]|uniref:Uncharacterized protein n=1 Tax=Suillus fuscotomentosus TaxID=1912939 RepID=A0AAD4E9S4_9AGAM|nr:uncharacterized protein F5891DRAFT_979627 [Suillus fuscotomentosus]KAG1901054.1 hypothetical protein F5891DRAFT_979627 [Suillus fuscotomentosus]
MHSIFKMQDILFLIFQMLYTLITKEDSGRLGAFAVLATTSSTISEPVLQLLWKKLPSVEPLIDLLPNDLIQRRRNSNGGWKLPSKFCITRTKIRFKIIVVLTLHPVMILHQKSRCPALPFSIYGPNIDLGALLVRGRHSTILPHQKFRCPALSFSTYGPNIDLGALLVRGRVDEGVTFFRPTLLTNPSGILLYSILPSSRTKNLAARPFRSRLMARTSIWTPLSDEEGKHSTILPHQKSRCPTLSFSTYGPNIDLGALLVRGRVDEGVTFFRSNLLTNPSGILLYSILPSSRTKNLAARTSRSRLMARTSGLVGHRDEEERGCTSPGSITLLCNVLQSSCTKNIAARPSRSRFMARTSIWAPLSDEEGKGGGKGYYKPPAPKTSLPGHPVPDLWHDHRCGWACATARVSVLCPSRNKVLAAPTSHSKAITRTSHAAETRGAITRHHQYVIGGGKSCKSRGDRSLLLPLFTAMYGSHFNFLEHRNETLSRAVSIRQANQKTRKQDRAPTESATHPEHHSASSQKNRTRRSLKSGQGYGIISVRRNKCAIRVGY